MSCWSAWMKRTTCVQSGRLLRELLREMGSGAIRQTARLITGLEGRMKGPRRARRADERMLWLQTRAIRCLRGPTPVHGTGQEMLSENDPKGQTLDAIARLQKCSNIAKQRPSWRRTKADVCVPVTFIPPAPAEPDAPPVVLMLSPGPSLLPSAPTPLPGAAPDVSDEDEEDVDSRSRPDTLMPREGNAEGASVGQSAVGLGLGAAAEGGGGECVGAVSMAGIENGKPDVLKDSGVGAEADCRPCQVLG
ncbi:hypothetical protein BCR44DRAFT_1187378 [Catenaria anguillulae PL171]|uniref:Uncharacterized protein n=1 Tax=Catenaria anguillulae PL171 TaxID=765915 RepID=A0A1Y2HHB9_9FUNG|nr:hypothetical protein BCR44DRAFT_1187378 [Catenaria anguillulae PL171]